MSCEEMRACLSPSHSTPPHPTPPICPLNLCCLRRSHVSTGGARVRPYRAGGHLRAGLPADGGGAAVRAPAAAEEDQGEQVLAAPVEEVN